MDPAAENQMASQAAAGQGRLQAFPEQDHDAHIATHVAYMNSRVSQMQPPLMMTLEKHVYEHLGLKAQVMIMNDPNMQNMPPEQMQSLIAQKQAEIIAEYQAQNPPQPQTDPLVEIKQQEVALRERELQLDDQNDKDKLQLEAMKTQQTGDLARERIASTEGIANMRAAIARERQANKGG